MTAEGAVTEALEVMAVVEETGAPVVQVMVAMVAMVAGEGTEVTGVTEGPEEKEAKEAKAALAVMTGVMARTVNPARNSIIDTLYVRKKMTRIV